MGFILQHKVGQGVHVKGLEEKLEFDIIVKSIGGTHKKREAYIELYNFEGSSLIPIYYSTRIKLAEKFEIGIGHSISGSKGKRSPSNRVMIYYKFDSKKYNICRIN